MPHEIESQLALAKQHFDELVRLIPLERLKMGEFGDGALRSRVEHLLQKLVSLNSTITRFLSQYLSVPDEPPIVTISSRHLAFYQNDLEPNAQLLQDARWDIFELRELLGDWPSEVSDSPKALYVLNALRWGVKSRLDMEEAEQEDWHRRGFDYEAAFNFVEEPIFRPDSWLDNRQLLRPVLVDRPALNIRIHVRYRLSEIYRAFTFGLWMATIALCRSVVEFSIKDRAPHYGIEITRLNSRNILDDKRLGELISDISEKLPSLKSDLETVRETGNRVLHPKKRDVIAFPKVLREEALRCVQATKKAVKGLYSLEESKG